MTGVLVKRGNLESDSHTGRRPREDEGRDGGMLLQAKEPHRLPETTRSWERPGPDSPSEPSAGSDPANTLISDFQPPEP